MRLVLSAALSGRKAEPWLEPGSATGCRSSWERDGSLHPRSAIETKSLEWWQEMFGGLDPIGGGGGCSWDPGWGFLQTSLFILHKTLLTHCLRHTNLEIVESLI